MQKEKQKKMTTAQFGPWLQEKTGAKFKILGERAECVVSIDHIEPGCFTALYVMPWVGGLAVFELADCYKSEAAAWQALAVGGETYLPLLFEEWVDQQYLTDHNAMVEKLDLP